MDDESGYCGASINVPYFFGAASKTCRNNIANINKFPTNRNYTSLLGS